MLCSMLCTPHHVLWTVLVRRHLTAIKVSRCSAAVVRRTAARGHTDVSGVRSTHRCPGIGRGPCRGPRLMSHQPSKMEVGVGWRKKTSAGGRTAYIHVWSWPPGATATRARCSDAADRRVNGVRDEGLRPPECFRGGAPKHGQAGTAAFPKENCGPAQRKKHKIKGST